MQMPRTAAGSRLAATWARWSRLVATAARRHWLLTLLLVAGLILRIITQITYRPALFYIDTIKYLYGAYAGNDPPGYELFLKIFLPVSNLDLVAALQHLLGLGMAVALYLLLLRRGSPKWLAALAAAPVLLDGYQLQMEQTIMPDVVFEALMVGGIVVLLWRPRPGLWYLGIAGILLGSTATMWQPGEILVVPAVVYAFIVTAGWRRSLGHAALFVAAFAVPILIVSFRNELAIKHFALAPYAASTIYGRMAYAADCKTLTLPAYEKPLCPPRSFAVKEGPDNLDHAASSPLKHLAVPPGMTQHGVASNFSTRVLEQQPLRVAGSILHDAVKLFAVHRVTSPGDAPITRWQFQTVFPQYPPYVAIVNGKIQFAELNRQGQPQILGDGLNFGGGPPKVITPLAKFLRAYQLDGGYTPGPALLFMLLAGLAGSAFLLLRRKRMAASDWDTARACCFFLVTGVMVLLISDAFEFSWRYQLPAILTLPPAAALGITVIINYVKGRGQPRSGDGLPAAAAAVPAVAATSGGPVTSVAGPADSPDEGEEEPAAREGIEDREPQGKNHASAG
jgi:hypothetical protein